MTFTLADPSNPTNLEIAEVFSRAREEIATRGWAHGRADNNGAKCAAGALAYVVTGAVGQMYAGYHGVGADNQVLVDYNEPTGTPTYADPDPGAAAIIDVLRRETGREEGSAPYLWNDSVALDVDPDGIGIDRVTVGTPIVLAKFDQIIEKYRGLSE